LGYTRLFSFFASCRDPDLGTLRCKGLYHSLHGLLTLCAVCSTFIANICFYTR